MSEFSQGEHQRPRASVLLVNYYNETEIINLAIGLHAKHGCNLEIVVVDNSQTMANIPQGLEGFMSIVPSGEGNSGYGRAMNLALDHAKSLLVFLVNPDVEIGDGSVIERLIERLESSPANVGAMACEVRNPDGTPQAAAISSGLPSIWEFARFTLLNAMPRYIRARPAIRPAFPRNDAACVDVIGFYGAFILFRAEALRSVGGFDPDFFMYCEDTELFRRRFSKRWRCVFCTDLHVWHSSQKSDVHKLMGKQQPVSFLLYLRKISIAHLLIYILINVPKAILMYTVGRHREESLNLLHAITYLPEICKRGGVGNVSDPPLKIAEIPD